MCEAHFKAADQNAKAAPVAIEHFGNCERKMMRNMIAFLIVLGGMSCASSNCDGQLEGKVLDIIERARNQSIEFADRKNKAVEAGSSFFGRDDRLTVGTEQQLRGTTAKKTPAEFRIGDWGYTTQFMETLDVVSNDEILAVSTGEDAQVLLIRGLKTDAVTDGVEFILQHPFVITETYSYPRAIGGKKTVLVLDVSKFNEKLEENRVAAEEALYHKWLIEDVEVVAKLIDSAKGKVTLLRKDDGSTVEMAFSGLNKDDQKWVREEIKRRRAVEKAEQEKARKAKQK